jgi:hypothetical protein
VTPADMADDLRTMAREVTAKYDAREAGADREAHA